MNEPWTPQAGIGGLTLALAILVSLISKKVLTPEEAADILDSQSLLLEELSLPQAGFSPEEYGHIAAGLKDLSYLRQMLQAFPPTRLPD